MPEIPNRRNDDFEEYGGGGSEDTDTEAVEEAPRETPITTWTPGMVGVCGFCGLTARMIESVRRQDGTAFCPRCGGTFAFTQENQSLAAETLDLTRRWADGATGRCNRCGLVARVFRDVARDDGTAGCEMCGTGTFEFHHGLPSSPFRAPAPRADFAHTIEGMTFHLRRRASNELLTAVLEKVRAMVAVEAILADADLIARFHEEGFTRYTVEEIKKAENMRRWFAHEPMLYTEEEKTRLGQFILLRVPFQGRARIQFAGLRGPVERWVTSTVLEDIRTGRRALIFDGHYKAPEAERIAGDPRIVIARQFFGKCNALLGRGIIRAWSPTGEEITLDNTTTWIPGQDANTGTGSIDDIVSDEGDSDENDSGIVEGND